MKYSVLHIEGGIGKNIVATNIVRNIKNTHPDRELIVVCPYPEVFVHNPYVYRVYKTGNCFYFYEDFIKNKDTLVFKHEPYNSDEVINKKTNLADAWCKSLGLELDYSRPELFFNQIEEENSRLFFQKYSNGKPIIAIQTNGGMGIPNNSLNFNWFRDLPLAYAQQIVKEYSKDFTFVQIRHGGQVQLEGTTQLDLNTRELFVFLTTVKGAICIDSVVQHLMAAYNKKSIVFWVGNSPIVYGYDLHTNIKANLDIKTQNIEGYLEPYPLQGQAYQCPKDYNANTLFDFEEIKMKFENTFLK